MNDVVINTNDNLVTTVEERVFTAQQVKELHQYQFGP